MIGRATDGSYTDKGGTDSEYDDATYIPGGEGGFTEVEKNPGGSYTDKDGAAPKTGTTTANPTNTAARSEASALLMRYCVNLLGR